MYILTVQLTSPLKLKRCAGFHVRLLYTVKPAFCDLTGHLNPFVIGECCWAAEANQPRFFEDEKNQGERVINVFGG